LEHILQPVGIWITGQISALGYLGVVIMMGIESACIPLPSEIIMPFSGYLTVVSPERFSLIGVAIAGALGCVVGSIAAYYAGLYGGRPFAERYGKYILLRGKDLDTADRWFAKHGNAAIFVSRLLPVVRTFISFPAGVARMNVPTFVIYTFIGSLPWCYALAYVGKLLGANWASVKTYFHNADVVIVAIVVLGIAFYLYRHLKPEAGSKE
jgi:membrane protein DedA with SNARE-associated domain